MLLECSSQLLVYSTTQKMVKKSEYPGTRCSTMESLDRNRLFQMATIISTDFFLHYMPYHFMKKKYLFTSIYCFLSNQDLQKWIDCFDFGFGKQNRALFKVYNRAGVARLFLLAEQIQKMISTAGYKKMSLFIQL